MLSLIGDKCNTNRKCFDKATVPFIGCSIHSFILTAKEIICVNEDLLLRVIEWMGKLKKLVLAAKISNMTRFVYEKEIKHVGPVRLRCYDDKRKLSSFYQPCIRRNSTTIC